MNFSDDDSEFSIVVHPQKLNEVEASVVKPSDVAIEPELNPAWVDDEDNTTIGNAVLSQPAILDIHSHIARKRQRISDVEKLYDVLGKDSQDVLDYNTRIFRMSDANMERLSSAPLTSFDKKESTLLADCVFERFPISCAKFTTQGDRVILVAKKHYFKVYDMSTSKVTHPKIPFDAEYGERVSSVQISPQNEIGAFLGSYGVYIVDLRSYEKLNTSRVSGSAVAHCFSQDGNLLNAFSSDGSIFVFDMRKNALPMHRWYDYSCVGGCSLAISNDSKYIACGSESGYVNIYTWESVMKNLTKRPKPQKTVGNLVTAVDQLRFHPSGEMLFMSSSLEPGAARLYDIENQRVHASFPACMGRLGKPVSVGFSPRGGYLAVGQSGGRAALYCLDWCGSKY
ncbi:unnamed protein product [Rodentolepis nana]|uniref:WD_REPEATS_REGION domain-containing protein n=1 Tax=Rodentolepis nana TaxID=102285 RepID=A0A158QHQ8_RODNA|nr:unnamed protein product [Rodentolepis nana]